MYRLLQMSKNPFPGALNATPLFHAKRNRVELVSDFAPNNEPEIVSSLQLHPQGWVAVSRNINSDERTEWCCVHDIQSYPVDPQDDEDINETKRSESNPQQQSERQSNLPPTRSRLNHRNGAMILAEYLQSHDPAIATHPDEVLQRPLPPMASRNEEQPLENASNDGFHIRTRSDTERIFLEILNRIGKYLL